MHPAIRLLKVLSPARHRQMRFPSLSSINAIFICSSRIYLPVTSLFKDSTETALRSSAPFMRSGELLVHEIGPGLPPGSLFFCAAAFKLWVIKVSIVAIIAARRAVWAFSYAERRSLALLRRPWEIPIEYICYR